MNKIILLSLLFGICCAAVSCHTYSEEIRHQEKEIELSQEEVHFKLGFEGNLGLNNMRILYPEYHVVNTNRFANLMVVAGFGF